MRLTAALVLGLAATTAAAQDRPVVAAVSYPLAYFAERLGGEAVTVRFDAPEGADPAFWRPSLAQIGAIQQADVIALNGAGFADWTDRASLPRSRVVNTAAGFADALIATETVTHSHGDGGAHSHTGTASHTWLDFAQAATQAEALADAMQRRLPDLRDVVAANRAALAEDLAALDAAARDAVSSLRGTTVLTSHPRYQYLARAYGFDTRAMEWEAGAMPSEVEWQALADAQAETGARVLLWEAAPPEDAMERARALGLAPVVFAPLAARPTSGDFLSVMRAQIDALARAAGAG